MLNYNFLPDLHCCGGKTNELDITAEIILYILYTLFIYKDSFYELCFVLVLIKVSLQKLNIIFQSADAFVLLQEQFFEILGFHHLVADGYC